MRKRKKSLYRGLKVLTAEALCAAVLLCGLHVTQPVPAAESEITFSYDEATCTLTVSGSGMIPDYHYTGLVFEDELPSDTNVHCTPWTAYKAAAKTLVMEEGITGVGKYAFDDFSALETIVLPDSIASMEAGGISFPCPSEEKTILLKGRTCSAAEAYAYTYGYTFEPTNAFTKGDMNENGKLEVVDALQVLRMVVQLDTMYPYSGDADGNGRVDAADALYILQCAVRLIKAA